MAPHCRSEPQIRSQVYFEKSLLFKFQIWIFMMLRIIKKIFLCLKQGSLSHHHHLMSQPFLSELNIIRSLQYLSWGRADFGGFYFFSQWHNLKIKAEITKTLNYHINQFQPFRNKVILLLFLCFINTLKIVIIVICNL